MKNKKKYIVIFAIILVFILSLFIPIRSETVWVNDDEIADVGHYEECYYNLYSIKIRGEKK